MKLQKEIKQTKPFRSVQQKASSVSGQTNTPPTDLDLAVARYQGRRVTQVTAALRNARITETK